MSDEATLDFSGLEVSDNEHKRNKDNEVVMLLLPHEEWVQKLKQLKEQEFVYPYRIEISKPDQSQKLIYLGIQHTSDLKDHQITSLREQWDIFREETEGKDRVAFVEGRRKPVFENETEAITKYFEGGLTSFLATQEGVEIVYPDENRREEIVKLLQEFSTDEILSYYLSSAAMIWHSLKSQEDYRIFIEDVLKKMLTNTDLGNIDLSADNLIEIYNKTQEHQFDINNLDNFRNNSDPATGLVSRASTRIRDTKIVSLIEKNWNEGKSIFVVYSSGHAITHEPALRHLLN